MMVIWQLAILIDLLFHHSSREERIVTSRAATPRHQLSLLMLASPSKANNQSNRSIPGCGMFWIYRTPITDELVDIIAVSTNQYIPTKYKPVATSPHYSLIQSRMNWRHQRSSSSSLASARQLANAISNGFIGYIATLWRALCVRKSWPLRLAVTDDAVYCC